MATCRASQWWQCVRSYAAFHSCEVPVEELTQARYQLLLEAIEMSTGIDELAALRKEIRLTYAGDDRVQHLDRLIDAHANLLMDEVGIDEGE